jgi:hypothetical protein
MINTINLGRPVHKGIDERVCDMVKHWANHLFKQFAGKLVVQLELYFAGIFSQWFEVPRTLQPTKWA